MNSKISKIKANAKVNVVFTDLFDTIIHRTVHPLYVYRIWAKLMIKELNISSSIIELYQIRISAIKTLTENLSCKNVEIPYEIMVKEVFNRLQNSNKMEKVDFETFLSYYTEIDYLAEKEVQFINEDIVSGLKYLKEQSKRIYVVSDFHLPVTTIRRLLKYHGIEDIFEDVFVSCDFEASKETGTLYPLVLESTNSRSEETAMIGDDKINDYVNPSSQGIFAQHLKHRKHKFRNKKNLFGSIQNEFDKICKKTENTCRKSDYPFSEYIIHFYFFTERLYEECRRKNINDLFFLAREGHYLKELFDKYQELNVIFEKDKVQTHYLKASRHSAMQVSLAPIEKEQFAPLRKKYDKMSTRDFLGAFNVPEEVMAKICEEVGVDLDEVIVNYISSDTLKALRKNELLVEYYDKHRTEQKKSFDAYLNSFGVDFKKEGMCVVDVGWGGTMQECIYQYFKGEVNVTGYYIGLKEIYTIEPKTKRFGLNFSVYPTIGYSDHILMANGQLYEQLLAAPHGSTLGYALDENSPTIEFHEPNEKKVYEDFISSIQEFMTEQFIVLNQNLKRCAYTDAMVQQYLTNMALRMGLLTNKKKLKFIHQISQGFYQNVGGNQVGIAYDPNALKVSKVDLVKQFIWAPEKIFRYLVKIKPLLYDKNLSWLGWTVSLSLYYYKLNFWLKNKFFSKKLIQ